MLYPRRLILETANAIEEINELEETIKWREPGYLTKSGCTFRTNWKEKNRYKMAMYFKCTSGLLPTFKAIYKNKFQFEGNRAILFMLNNTIPESELKRCISLALR